MPAPKIFLTSSDIADVTGMSVRSAQNMLCMFDQRGQTVRCGISNRGRMVGVDIFVKYLCQQDGADPGMRKKDIMDCLRELGRKHTTKDVRKEPKRTNG